MAGEACGRFFAWLAWRRSGAGHRRGSQSNEVTMAWSTPTLTEIAIGLEINGYLPPEF